MIIDSAISVPVESHQCHDDFLPLKVRVERHARFAFRHFPPSEREEAACEAVAAAFRSFVRLKARGKNPADFPSQMSHWATMVVMDGRHENSHDAMSPKAQRRHGFRVQSLSGLNRRPLREPQTRRGQHGYSDEVEEQLYENARTPPAEQAIFRIDFRDWLNSWAPKDRGLIDDLVLGERTADVASKHRITAGRVSQKRRQFRADWERYCDEPSNEEDGRDFAA
jgi:hypothetical protein